MVVTPHRRRLGQFFTPEAVVATCFALLEGELPATPKIVDPACGDGAFLRYAAARGLAPPGSLTGCDVDEALVAGLAAQGLSGVRLADALQPTSLPAEAFDLVVGNPPFGVSAPRDGRGLPSEVRFLLRAIELARPGGHVVLVLPSGVLANERLRALRAGLLRRCTLLATIETPRETFRAAGTSAACSILALRLAQAPPGHRVFFGIAPHLEDLPSLVAAYHGGREQRATAGSDLAADSRPSSASSASSAAKQPGRPESFRLPQGDELAQRMDAGFWRPAHRELLDRMARRFPLRTLGELVGRAGLIAGDHVRPSRGESKGPGLPYEYYQTREFLPAGYNYARLERCDERALRRLSYTAVRRHDILVSCAGVGGAGRGRACLVTHEPGPSCTGDVFILRPSSIDPIYLFLFLCSHAGRAQLLRQQNGVGTANLSVGELLQVRVPLVPADVQRALARDYRPVAAAHDRSLAVLAGGDTPRFEREQEVAEALLAELVARVERLCGLE